MASQQKEVLQPTLERLAKLIQRQYGCEMVYLFQNELQKEVRANVRQELLKGTPVTKADSIYFPILINKALTGAVVVKSSAEFTVSRTNYLHQVIKMILETTLLDLDRLQLVEHFEAQMQVAEAAAKVTPISHYQDDENTIMSTPKSMYEDNFDFPCLIESKDSFDIFKMALEIHGAAGRFAMLSIQDLDAGVIESEEKLNSIGRVSLFVDDISRLTLEQQTKLSDYLNRRERLEAPQLIVGTTRPYGELKNDANVNQVFLSQISIGYLQMSQPFKTYKKENLIQFFFEGLSGRARLTLESALHTMAKTNSVVAQALAVTDDNQIEDATITDNGLDTEYAYDLPAYEMENVDMSLNERRRKRDDDDSGDLH